MALQQTGNFQDENQEFQPLHNTLHHSLSEYHNNHHQDIPYPHNQDIHNQDVSTTTTNTRATTTTIARISTTRISTTTTTTITRISTTTTTTIARISTTTTNAGFITTTIAITWKINAKIINKQTYL